LCQDRSGGRQGGESNPRGEKEIVTTHGAISTG